MRKLFGKVPNVEDVVRFPNFIPTGIVPEGHYPGIFQPLDFGKPSWPKGICLGISPCTDCRPPKSVNKNYGVRRS